VAEPTAFENIALAHQEIYTLYEIAQTMGTSLNVSDTMRLIASKLSAIIPWSGCALYVTEQEQGSLHCRFAVGLDAPQLEHGRINNGEGLSGVVATQRQTLLNADPVSNSAQPASVGRFTADRPSCVLWHWAAG
jgi:signal transduction protein with GAF and PtsI domain